MSREAPAPSFWFCFEFLKLVCSGHGSSPKAYRRRGSVAKRPRRASALFLDFVFSFGLRCHPDRAAGRFSRGDEGSLCDCSVIAIAANGSELKRESQRATNPSSLRTRRRSSPKAYRRRGSVAKRPAPSFWFCFSFL